MRDKHLQLHALITGRSLRIQKCVFHNIIYVRPADQISVMSGFEIVSYSHSKPKYGVDIQFPFFTEMKCLASYLPVYLHANVINV